MAKIDEVLSAISVLKEEIDTLKAKLEPKIQELAPQLSSLRDLYPIPAEYEILSKEILNKDFQIKVEPLSDSPAFQFTVIVPDKYSNISPSYKEMYKADIRPKVISYTEGTQGVRAWLERVFTSFNPTVQGQIVADR